MVELKIGKGDCFEEHLFKINLGARIYGIWWQKCFRWYEGLQLCFPVGQPHVAWQWHDSKITADGDCSREIKWCLLIGRKAMTNLYSILQSRDITLSVKVHLVKAMVFPVVIYGCESWAKWALKNWCFWIMVLEKKSPWTARRSN